MGIPCNICGNSDSAILENKKLDLYRCRFCDHVFSGLCVKEEGSPDLYGKDYFFGGGYRDYLADREILQKNFKSRLKTMRSFLDPVRHRRLLEIGCAYGFFLHLAKRQFDAAVGIDVSKDAVLYARERLKLDVINADFIRYDFGGQKFDVVCMWDAIKHLRNPELCLSKINRHT